MAEPIDLPIWLWTQVGLMGGHIGETCMASTTELLVCCCDASLCQITLNVCCKNNCFCRAISRYSVVIDVVVPDNVYTVRYVLKR